MQLSPSIVILSYYLASAPKDIEKKLKKLKFSINSTFYGVIMFLSRLYNLKMANANNDRKKDFKVKVGHLME